MSFYKVEAVPRNLILTFRVEVPCGIRYAKDPVKVVEQKQHNIQ